MKKDTDVDAHARVQVTGDINVPAGRVAFSAWAAALPEPWERQEADLMAYRHQLANQEEDGDGAAHHERPQKRVRPFCHVPRINCGFQFF